jgi:hypothetical protein
MKAQICQNTRICFTGHAPSSKFGKYLVGQEVPILPEATVHCGVYQTRIGIKILKHFAPHVTSFPEAL